MDGSERLAERDLESLRQHGGDSTFAQAQRRLGDGPEERVVIDRHLDATSELGGGEIARDRQERRAIEVGVAHPRRQVRGAGPERRDAEAGGAGHPSHDVGRERRRALVGGEHVRQPARAHGLDHGEDVAAGDPEAVAHARRPQRLDDQLGVVHRDSQSWSRPTLSS